MRTAGDPVIAGAGLLGVNQQRKGAPPGDRLEVGDAEHGGRIGRPIDTVALEVPAIVGLPHAGEDVFQVELAPGAAGVRSAPGVRVGRLEIEHAPSALRARLRRGTVIGKLF
jgi:hypothetical protein